MTTILITGFGRFPGAPYNPSEPLARTVARRRRPALAYVKRVVHIFETSYAAVDRDLPKLSHAQADMAPVRPYGPHAQVRIETRRATRNRFVSRRDRVPAGGTHRARRTVGTRARPVRRPARRRTVEPRARTPVARCRAVPLQLRLLARAGGVPIRHARAVHPHSAGRACRAATWTAAPNVARRPCPRRRGHFARTSGGAASFRLIRCPAAAQRFGRAS